MLCAVKNIGLYINIIGEMFDVIFLLRLQKETSFKPEGSRNFQKKFEGEELKQEKKMFV